MDSFTERAQQNVVGVLKPGGYKRESSYKGRRRSYNLILKNGLKWLKRKLTSAVAASCSVMSAEFC